MTPSPESPGRVPPDLPAWSRSSAALALGAASPTGSAMDGSWQGAGADGTGVRVAVVDSGIDADHPGLEGCVDAEAAVAFTVASDGRVERNDGPHGDAFGHGTACAGIIHQLAPGALITSIKVLGAGLRGRVAAFHAGLRHAVDEGFDVVNLSLGTRRPEWALAFHELCDEAYFANTVVVTAADNVARQSHPSLYASVVSVAANLSRDPWRYHANPEPPTEFCALGVDVPVLWLGHGRSIATGNSYAAPHIAAMAVLVRSRWPGVRPFQVKAALWAGAVNVRESTQRAELPPERAGRLSRGFTASRRLSGARSAPAGVRPGRG